MNILRILYLMVQQQTKYQTYLLGVGIIVLLTACKNDDEPIPVVPGTDIPKETAYLSLAVNTGDVIATRTYNGTFAGTAEEQFVDGVRLVLYNGSSDASIVIKSIDYNIKTVESGSGAWTGSGVAPTTDQSKTDRFITYGEEVAKMNYQALVLVNPNAAMKSATSAGATYATFRAAQRIENTVKTSDIGGLAKSKYFAMANANGLVPVSESLDLQDTRSGAHTNPVPVSVERMVAKVTLVAKNNSSEIPCSTTGCSSDQASWGLDVTNKWTFWMRRGTESSGSSVNTWYAEDPNYSNISSTSESNRINQFFYYLNQSASPSNLPNTLNGSEYCLENTMTQTEQLANSVVTRVLIRCRYKPTYIAALGDGFYIRTYVVPNGFGGYVTGYHVYSCNDMKILQQQAEDQQRDLITLPEQSLVIMAAKAEGYDFSTGGIPKRHGIAVTESFETGALRYYHNGINYFAIKIRHFGENDTSPYDLGHYGVLRNTHYTVTVNAINGPGAINLESTDLSTRAADAMEDSGLYSNIKATITLNNSYEK